MFPSQYSLNTSWTRTIFMCTNIYLKKPFQLCIESRNPIEESKVMTYEDYKKSEKIEKSGPRYGEVLPTHPRPE